LDELARHFGAEAGGGAGDENDHDYPVGKTTREDYICYMSGRPSARCSFET
jgi:hypothetical protein